MLKEFISTIAFLLLISAVLTGFAANERACKKLEIQSIQIIRYANEAK